MKDSTEALRSEWYSLAGPIGRNDHPAALFDAWEAGEFDGRLDLFAVALETAYSLAEYPCRLVGADSWAMWFREVGFTVNGEPADRPGHVPTLWRATVPPLDGWTDDSTPPGLSWTDNRAQAEMFHARNRRFGWPSVLLEARDVPPGDVLARIHGEDNRAEDEWLIEPYTDADIRIVDEFDGTHPDTPDPERDARAVAFRQAMADAQAAALATWAEREVDR